jgi:threonine dehydrogenase-like Zn-dependent dehydrogenase
MKAVVFHDVGDIRLDTVPEPKLLKKTDAIVRLTASAICGTDLHFVRGTLGGMKPGTILGHEGVGIVEDIGKDVRNLRVGDRVVIPSTIACGVCSYCRAAYYSQCDKANPNGHDEGTPFFGGPASSGPFDGLQAESARIPFANVGPMKLPDNVSDEDAIMLSDIFPTGYFGAELANISPGKTVAVFGCGPVGQFAIASAKLMGAGRIFAIDMEASRLDMARAQGAEAIDFNTDDPCEVIKESTDGIGVDRAIDAVGVDANVPTKGPAAKKAKSEKKEFNDERREIAPKTNPDGALWKPGTGPSQVLRWAVEVLAKAGTLAIVGVYSENSHTFPIGDAMEKNLTIRMGNCPHRRYLPRLIELVRSGAIVPSDILTEAEPLTAALEAYEAFDLRKPGWIKVTLEPAGTRASV